MKVFVRISFVCALAVVILVGGLVVWFYSGIGLPKLSSLAEYKAAQNSKIFAADGTLLTELHGDENREIVALEKIPADLQHAVIAIEDDTYYQHGGIDWKGVVRALWANVVKGEVVQGGSTIPQQYVKNAYVGPERTLWRKIQEAHLAYQLSKKYSKDKILELYLNDIYFGQSCYGIFTAARKYFGKQPQELSLAECAMLAGVIRSPSYYDPYERPQAVIDRRNLVLDVMAGQGYITREEADTAKQEELDLQDPNKVYVPPPAPYFCDYITERVIETYGDQKVYRGGLRIYTTLDLELQGVAEQTLCSRLDPETGPDASLVCIDPRTGYIKAMVGGKNYYNSQFNVAAEGHRQAGSSFKVFVLVRALADRMSPNETYDSSSPKTIKLPDGQNWTVRNYSGGGGGYISITSATIRSVNVVFAQLIMDVGAGRVADMAHQMGIITDIQPNPAIALGGLEVGVTPLEMASAYGTLANNGVHSVPRAIYKVTDAEGNIIDEFEPETNTVIDPDVASEANKILQKVVSSGTGTGARIGRPQAGKTGTTEDHADAWFVGYTPDLVTAVWVGYPEGRISMGGMCGGDLPASIWREFMNRALQDVPETAFPDSDESFVETETEEEDYVTVTICEDSGLLANPYCPHTVTRQYKRGNEPTEYCTIHTAPDTTTVPNVVGMTLQAAKSSLTQAGFTVSVVQESSSDYVSGTVISQTPAAGTNYATGSPVTITVSTGAPTSVVPNVIGLSEAAAKTKLAVSGFSVSATYTVGSPPGTVISQSPGAGTNLPAGSTVSIVIAQAQQGSGRDILALIRRVYSLFL